MIRPLSSPWEEQFNSLITQARSSLFLCAPFISRNACERILRLRKSSTARNSIQFDVLTELSVDNILNGTIDVPGLIELKTRFKRSSVRILPCLHAKIYIADGRSAVVTSSNLTDNGLFRNFEYGILVEDEPLVAQIEQEAVAYAALGTALDENRLSAMATVSSELRDVAERAQQSVRSTLRKAFNEKLREADIEILRARTAGRTAHAICADTMRYLLSTRAMSTVEMHSHIRRIHPDLCDDSVDRVIDGRHYGKKWKHAVRTAQVYLRRNGTIELSGRLWRLSASTDIVHPAP